MAKQRLDTLLVERQLCDSRQQAQRLIRAGEVRVNQQVVDKPGTEIDLAAEIEVKARSPYVSRGGEKLAKAIAQFGIAVTGRVCLDAGISTGGFTDCLLQSGAVQVYGIDVGYGQVDWKLRQDPRLILRERTNIRYLTPASLYGGDPVADRNANRADDPDINGDVNGDVNGDASFIQPQPDLGVADVSFISLTKILLPLWDLLRSPREVVLLVKPQFEVGRGKVGKKGVVRDTRDQAEAILNVLQAALELGWQYHGLTWSPLTGPAGNLEYLLWLRMDAGMAVPDLGAIAQLTSTAQQEMA